MEGEVFKGVVRTAVSISSNCDALTCIAGAIIEGCYGIQEVLKQECRTRLKKDCSESLTSLIPICFFGNKTDRDDN